VLEERGREKKVHAFATYAGPAAIARLLPEKFVSRSERELASATVCVLEEFDANDAHVPVSIAH
jgi:hypothetical protein